MVIECGYDEDRQMFYVSYLSKILLIDGILILREALKLMGDYHLY